MLSTPRLPTQTRPYRFCVHRATGFTLQCELTFALVCQGLTQVGGINFHSQPVLTTVWHAQVVLAVAVLT
jgi:hypothetical protein